MRDINLLNPLVNPLYDGDIVKIGQQTWIVKNDTNGWYITSDGTWRGMHKTINKILSMSVLISEIVKLSEVC